MVKSHRDWVSCVGPISQPFRGAWFALFLALSPALLGAGIPATASSTQDEGDLKALIEVGFAHTEHSMEARQTAIEQARVLLAANQIASPLQRGQFGLADAYLQYQLGNVEGAIAAIQLGLTHVSLTSHPNLYVRSRSLLGGLLLTAGKQQEGMQTLEALFKQNLSTVEPIRIENARVNYASALAQSGHIQQASLAYEQALLFALSNEVDVLALSAGSNYISLLRNQSMSSQARYWLEQLRPAMQRKPNVMATAALMLYDYALILNSDDSALAITKIENFLAHPEPRPNLVRAHGEELYADALLAQGRPQESQAAAERSLALLDQYPLEQPEARMAKIRALLALQKYEAAEEELEHLANTDISRPSNITNLEQLRLEHALRTGNTEAATLAFEDFLSSNNKLVNFLSQRQTDYYAEKLDKQRTELELKLVKEEQALLAAEATTLMAQANEAKMRESSLQQQQAFIVGFSLLAILAGIGVLYFNGRRALQTRLREKLRKQNASLTALVESKSQDLVKQVTEQSQLKHALAESRHMEAIGQIAGHVAHDFNNVLQVIASTNDLLADQALSPKEKKALAASNQSVRSGSSTVRQLLAYSRNQQLETRVFNVSSYLKDTGALFHSAVGDVNQLILDDRTKDAWVKLDAGQLTASIINLLRNAADAMDASGEIVLSASIATEAEGAAQSLLLQVIDQGRGMNEEAMQQASRPYYTTKQGGTGLGLSSIYGFALQSGGQVQLTSELGSGTCVALRFPLYQGATDAEPTDPVEPQTLVGARILVVEDNPLIAQTLIAILAREGAQSQWVTAADQAQVELSRGDAFDLMLSDIKIPGPMDGFGLAQWVRAQHPQVRIGMMSGYGPSVEEDFDVPVLAKPFTAEELVDYLTQRHGSV